MLTGALTEKITLDTSGKIPKAVGVQINKDGKSSVLTAKREVILAAGVFGTPKLLELSVIGGKPLLDKLGFPVVVDNPNVNENLQDHPNTDVSFEVADGMKTMDGLSRQEPEAFNSAMEDYINHKRGPLAVGGNFAGALLLVSDFVKGAGPEALPRHSSRSWVTRLLCMWLVMSRHTTTSSSARCLRSQVRELQAFSHMQPVGVNPL